MDFRERLPAKPKFQEIGGHLRRAANAVASNYRAAGRERSHAQFTAKIGTVLEEADESQHCLEMLAALDVQDEQLAWLQRESGELVAIFTASYKTASRRRRRKPATRWLDSPMTRFSDAPIPDSPIVRFPDRAITDFPITN